MKVVVLGGSAYSTPALWSYLANDAQVEGLHVVLAARNSRRLSAVASACHALDDRRKNRLDTCVVSGRSDWRFLDGATVVLIQVRSGGYAGRDFDETFPLHYGIAGDEGLGPGGLSAGVRNWRAIRPALHEISQRAPAAMVLMMSSPVGLLVRATRRHFPGIQVAGICELPWTTLMDVCNRQSVEASHAEFNYFGINHLGWLYGIKAEGQELSPAVPLKYVRLHNERAAVVREQRLRLRSRGSELRDISMRAFEVFKNRNPDEIRRALNWRDAPWYRFSVGPFIAALAGSEVRIPFFLSVPNEGCDSAFLRDDVLEYPCRVARGLARRMPRSLPVPDEMMNMISGFIAYERIAADAVSSGDAEHIAAALRAHPWLQCDAHAVDMAREIFKYAQAS